MVRPNTRRPSPKAANRARKPSAPRLKPKPKPKPKTKIPAKAALVADIPQASHAVFTANGAALLVLRDTKKTLTLYDLATGMETPPLKTLPTASTVALSADSRYLAMGTSTGILAVDSTQAGKVAWKTKAAGTPIAQVLFTLDGSCVLVADAFQEEGDAWFRVYHTADGQEDKTFDPVTGARVCHLALSPDGLFLAHSEMRSHSVLVWHLPTRQMGACIQLQKSNGPIVGLAFGVNVRHLYVAQSHRVSAWNGENALPLADMAVEGVASLALINAASTVATLRTGPQGSALNLWNAESGHLRKTITLPDGDYGPLAAPPAGTHLALPGPKTCWIWNAEKLVS
jgi:WD40 repeat protein